MGWRSQRQRGLGNWSQGTLPVPCPRFTQADLGDFLSWEQLFNVQPVVHSDHIRHPGQHRTLRAAALSARGIALTRNHIGKQPQAGLGRGPKAREGGKGAAAGRTRDKSQLE